MFGDLLNASHRPGWRGWAATAAVYLYTAAVIAAIRIRGVRARMCGHGQIVILGPRYGRGRAMWASYIGLLARDARERAIIEDKAVEFDWARMREREQEQARARAQQ